MKFSVEFGFRESDKLGLSQRRKGRQVRRNKKVIFFTVFGSGFRRFLFSLFQATVNPDPPKMTRPRAVLGQML